MSDDGSPPSGGDAPDADTVASGGSAGGDLLEKVVVVASVLLIVGMIGYLVSQALVAPATPAPTATVDAVEPMRSGEDGAGSVRVTVSLVNRGGHGLSSVEVAVRCGAADRSLVFTHVPARGHRVGTVVCPRRTSRTASVATWIEA